jgi:hypothetical protein
MGTIRNLDYIKDIGIKKILCHTNMGNTIYILNNGKKYKEFSEDYRDLNDFINKEFQESLVSQTEEYGHSIISYPEIVISSSKELYGIVGNYEEGIPLLEIDTITSIDMLLSLIESLEEGIKDISLKGWNLEDLHEDNIIINTISKEIPIRIIDTDYHVLQLYKDRLELYKNNMKRIFNAIMTSILPTLSNSSILQNKDIEEQYILASNGIIKVSEFLKFLLLKIKQSTKEQITIKTLQKSI